MDDMEMTIDEYEMQSSSPNRDEHGGCGGGNGGRGGGGNGGRGLKRGHGGEEEINSEETKDDKGKGRASKAWQFFEKIKLSSTEVYAECKICSKRLKGHYKDGTSHLNNHYRRCLQESMGKGKNQKEIPVSVDEHGSAIMGSYTEQNQYKCDMDEFKLLTARMIILHEFPLSMVEYVGFRDLIKKMQPQLYPVSRNTIKNENLKMYDVEKEKVMKLLDECNSRIAITTDMWTASYQKGDTWL